MDNISSLSRDPNDSTPAFCHGEPVARCRGSRIVNLVGLQRRPGEYILENMNQVQATIAHHDFVLESRAIERTVGRVLPEPLTDHFVVVGGRRYPPKQVISLVTGLDRADFTTHHARRVLRRLGFVVGRRSDTDQARQVSASRGRGPHKGHEADLLRTHAGQWVAQRGLEVLVAADTPQEVLSWLERHDERADAMFLVPAEEWQAEGISPH